MTLQICTFCLPLLTRLRPLLVTDGYRPARCSPLPNLYVVFPLLPATPRCPPLLSALPATHVTQLGRGRIVGAAGST